MLQNLSSAAFVIGALMVKFLNVLRMLSACSLKKLVMCNLIAITHFFRKLKGKSIHIGNTSGKRIFEYHIFEYHMFTPVRRHSKTSLLSTNVDQKLFETEFLIAINRPTGDKWQSKMLFLASFDPRSLIVKSVFDCHLPSVMFIIGKCYGPGTLAYIST